MKWSYIIIFALLILAMALCVFSLYFSIRDTQRRNHTIDSLTAELHELRAKSADTAYFDIYHYKWIKCNTCGDKHLCIGTRQREHELKFMEK
jgi:hypothetical protein